MGMKSIHPFEILYYKEPFEVASFEHCDLKQHLNMTAKISPILKCPTQAELFCFEGKKV